MGVHRLTTEAPTVRAKRFDTDRVLALGTDDLRGLDAPRRLVGLIVAVTLAGGLLRFATLSQSVWFDEAFAIREVSGSFGHMLGSVVHHESSPPLYFSLLWVWRRLFGDSAVDMRTMSALAGTVTIPLAFTATRRLVGDRAALIVTALLAASPAMLYYSQELRMYAVLILLSTLAFGCFVALIQSPSRLLFAGWAVLSILAMATHYFAALVAAPEAAWLIARWWRDPSRRRQAVAASIPVAVAGACLLVLLEYQQHRVWPYTTAVLTSPFVHQRITGAIAGQGDSLPRVFQALMVGPGGPLKPLLIVAAVLLLLFGWWLRGRAPADRPERRGADLALVLLIPATITMIVMLALRVFVEGRYFFACWILAITVVAAGLASWQRRSLAIVVTSCVCVAWVAIGLVSSVVPQLASREDTRAVARTLGTATRSRLVAIDQRFDVAPLQLYRPTATVYTHRTVTTREIDVVLMPKRDVPSYTNADRPSSDPVSHLPYGLELRQVVKGDTFLIERYMSKTPVRVRLYPSAGSFSDRFRFLYEPAGGKISSL